MVVYDFDSAADYVHQVGRTGRRGQHQLTSKGQGDGTGGSDSSSKGKSIAFYVEGDGDAHELAMVLDRSGQQVPRRLREIAVKEKKEEERKEEKEGRATAHRARASIHGKRLS